MRTRREDPLRELFSFGGQVADAVVPSVAFLVVWLVGEGVRAPAPILAGAIGALVVAVGIGVWRHRRGESLWAALAGVVVAAVSAGLALYTGRPEFFFVPRVAANAVSLLAWVVSILVRWPLLGIVVGAALRHPAAWRRDPDLLRGYQRASWLWASQYALRLAVFVPLWAAHQPIALGLAQAALTWPLVMLCVVLSWPLVRSALPEGHPGPREPVLRCHGSGSVVAGRHEIHSDHGVVLRRMGDDDVEALVEVAVADATPPEVMPPDDEPVAPQDWTPARRTAYAAFLRARPATEASFVVLRDGAPVGVARLAETSGGRVETGIWLGRGARGGGVGGAVLELLIEQARSGGARELVADTTAGNHAALASLRRAGATLTPSSEHADVVDARLSL